MRLAFNATSLLSPLTGIGQYSRQLALGLKRRNDIDASFFYGAAWQKEVRNEAMPGAATVLPWIRKHVPLSYTLRRFIQEHRFDAGTRLQKFDVYHEPNILPLPFDGPNVVTVHDLSWIRFPEMHPMERVRAMNKYFEPGLHRATVVLTDSEFVKREVVETFGIDPERIQPIPLGVESLFRPRSAHEIRATLERNGLAYGKYLLAVGTLEPRKNLSLALRSYARLPERVRKHFPLVLVGMKGWLTSSLETQLAPMLQSGEVKQLGYLTREELAYVIAGATSLVYPSVYEGFGLPPLEAMASAVPVIASNVSSIPEVVGDTGILIDPLDVGAATDAMRSLIDDDNLREKLALKALERSRDFTWEKCIDRTIQSYYQAIDAHPASTLNKITI
ncbi:glycosyltransferase family 4 protein [Noviherbaspirillum pedocola]|nr:glycosyltransferase family 1 protein [Noviherbaspirillum pedocola]